MDHEEIQALLGAYALDAVEPDEREAIERHFGSCPRCAAEVAGHRETAGLLAFGGAPAPEALWEKISEKVSPAPIELDSYRHRRAPGLRIAMTVAAVAALMVAFLAVRVVEQDRRIDTLTAGLEGDSRLRAANAALLDPRAHIVSLRSPAQETLAEVVVLPDGDGYVVRDSLPSLSNGRTYQLWALTSSDPVSAGVLGSDPDVVAFRFAGPVEGFAVTDEKAGGVAAPTAAPIAIGFVHTS